MARPTLRSIGLENEALRLEVHMLKADIVALRSAAPSVKPAAAKPPLTAHWTQRPVFYVAFDQDHAFKARAAASRKLNRVVMASKVEVATGRGTHTMWELR
jgi:hypothetical protein